MAVGLLGPPRNYPIKRKVSNLKLRYSCAVTVCIAVACQEQGDSRIVLCSDTRLDYDYLGSTNTTCKIDVLGYGWCAQMAGHWSGVQELCAILKRKVRSFRVGPRSSEIITAAQKSVAEFLKSPLYQSDQTVQLLLSGFDENFPVIVDVSVYPNDFRIDYKVGFGAVGSGFQIASTLLQLRESNPAMPLSYGAYLAYEAKRGSEKAAQVGRLTALSIQAPPSHDDRERAWVKVMGEQGLANLESLYRTLWKTPLADFPDLTDECFVDPTKKQSPE